MAHGLLLMNHK